MATRNGRVTNNQLFDAITDLRKELKGDIEKLDDRIDSLAEKRSDLQRDVASNQVAIDQLNRRVTSWDVGNTIGIIVAGVLAFFGIRN